MNKITVDRVRPEDNAERCGQFAVYLECYRGTECSSDAEVMIEIEGEGSLFLCRQCAENLHAVIGKFLQKTT